MQAFLNTAVKAARLAGDTALRYSQRLNELDVRSKSRNEFVSQVDIAAEEAIIETIHERHGGAFPGNHGRYVLRSFVNILEGAE